MPRRTQGKPAQYKHGGVRYFPFDVKPGSSLVLTSDPWVYLNAFLKEKISKSRGDNAKRYKRALYFSKLSEEFYRTSEITKLPAKATLSYYGVLNLVKCFICVKGKLLGDSIEHHGLSPSTDDNKDIKVSKRAKNHVNIFHEFVVALGSDRPTSVNYSFEECLAHIPEIHELAFRLNLLSNNKRNLIPIGINLLFDDTDSWLFTELYYWKKHEVRANINRFYCDRREAYLKPGNDDGTGKIIFRCKRRKRFEWNNFEKIYSNACRDISKLDIVTLLTRDGYRFYVDLDNANYHHLAYSFLVIFHLGTVTRYSPSKTEKLMDGKLKPILSEVLSLTPKQMLFQLVSYMTNTVCVVPFSKL